MSTSQDGNDFFRPVVNQWFRTTFGRPTPAQELGWKAILRGEHTLILAPTGSGKTLAAFMACLDHLWRTPRTELGVRILYISPLKALNEDVSRNLEFPLRGIEAAAIDSGVELPTLTIGVRSGDTPAADRQKMIRKPPDILISTPESLHLLLTSNARKTLRSISYVIVDEIHALCSNKRGVFLSLLLERLEALNPKSFLRIGLSATQRPLEEVARYLGGIRRWNDENGHERFEPRPVTIVDTAQKKSLDLEVIAPFADRASSLKGSVWPKIERILYDLIERERSTIVFTNNRRVAERLTSHLNQLAEENIESEVVSDDAEPTVEFARAHHGSLNLSERRLTEDLLKRGELSAVVSTASLELGIDMGAVDLVCQVESPGSIARALQRVGRAGHFVGRISRGRLIAKTAADLLETAALCREMTLGNVEHLRVPTNCLDILAQQVVACVAVETWSVADLFRLLKQSYSYRDLPASAFESVLKMLSGRFPSASLRDLRPRISWDRVHNRLAPLPGTAKIALLNGGTIPDTGQYPVYFGEGGPKIGELDEEFVLERRVGETFIFGTATWKIEAIEPLKVIVGRSDGGTPLVPFWRGEDSPRSGELGEAVGALSRTIADRIDDTLLPQWLVETCKLDPNAAEALIGYCHRQLRIAGAVPDDRTIILETFHDQAGELGLAVLTPFGGRLHQPLKLAIQARLRERFGIDLTTLHADDGLLIRLPNTDDIPFDILDGLTPELAQTLIRQELDGSALFGLRFRQNAGRSLLMPRPDPSKRTPLWLQRLRARDLLQVVRHFSDFPVVVETHRECLEDELDIPRLNRFLNAIQNGEIRIVKRNAETPSPFVSELLLRFEYAFMYQWDEPTRAKPGANDRSANADIDLLDELMDSDLQNRWLDPNAVGRVENRLRGFGHLPRSLEEMAETLRQYGDLSESELSGPMLGFLNELESQGRALRIRLEDTIEPIRWISAEESPIYEQAFASQDPSASLDAILSRYFRTHALVGLDTVRRRYPIDILTATEAIERLTTSDGLVKLNGVEGNDAPVWVDARNLTEIRRVSIALKRKESIAVAPEVFADFLVRHQQVHPLTMQKGREGVAPVLEQLQGFAATAEVWESLILPARIQGYRADWLDEAIVEDGWIWRAAAEGRPEPRVAITPRDFAFEPKRTGSAEAAPLSEFAAVVLELLQTKGASYLADLSRYSAREPSKVREAIDELVMNGLASNDQFEPLRARSRDLQKALLSASSSAEGGRRGGLGRPRPRVSRRRGELREGRWFGVPTASESLDRSEHLTAWASVLLDRYGVLTREMLELEAFAPPWKELLATLSRAELRGDVRRGYFVEGLSGIQFASSETAESLARSASQAVGDVTPVWLSTLDPANLYGSGAPFDVQLLEGGTARLNRSSGNDLVLIRGRPILIIEASGKRLTGLASASEAELKAAIALLPRMTSPGRRVIKVETYNQAAALASPAAPWLADAGFVRDYPGMTYYADWST